MARPQRIEYPDACYHVSNFSELTSGLFPSEQFYTTFLEDLKVAAERFNVTLLAWCLLKKEYHLLIKTPEGNLSRFMRQVDGVYTQRFQRLKKKRGSVFRTRYKSVLVQPEKWLLPLSRYLHNLPKKARQNPLAWQWSSLAHYLADREPPGSALKTNEILTLAGELGVAYGDYLAQGGDAELSRFYSKKNQPSILGDQGFRQRVRTIADVNALREMSKGKPARQRPSPNTIVSSVADTFNVSDSSILRAARGPGSKNVPRWVAMYLCQEAGGITLRKIAQQFGLQRYGTVSTTIGKLKDEFNDDPPLAYRVERIRQQLYQ